MKGCASGLALKKRRKTTRKWSVLCGLNIVLFLVGQKYVHCLVTCKCNLFILDAVSK